ncbi:MAG: hypothetical protein Ct9H300mP8_09520 [Gammaproteobacteria bacterium]|nr:MAG: hypothetical protein Ct9H300mP8_09520 [Gammaproteobacteria bacterium]
MPGLHNVRNAVAAVAVATEEGIADDPIQQGLRDFRGVGRRFEKREIQIGKKHLTLVDDYGHHPTGLENVLNTARMYGLRDGCSWCTSRIVIPYA